MERFMGLAVEGFSGERTLSQRRGKVCGCSFANIQNNLNSIDIEVLLFCWFGIDKCVYSMYI